MRTVRAVLAALLAATLFAQQEESPEQIFRATVNVVVAPVTVLDDDGNYVNNLRPSDFRLLDNGQPQDIKVDVTYVPISLVVIIQANSAVEALLPSIKKIGPMLQGAVVGEQGEVAVLCFDHRIQKLQDFTTDPDLINRAMEKLKPGSQTHRMIDAVMEGIRMLSHRPANRRRIIMLISETIDGSSENKTREVLTMAQLHNVLIYPVIINRLVTTLTAKPQPPRPDPYPAGARPLPPNVPPTPEASRMAVAGAANSASFIPVFIEIFRQVKGIFIPNPVEVFSRYTGGRERAFITHRDLERAILDIGEEVHSQYLLTYVPNNKLEGGFHEIKVEVLDRAGRPRRDVKVITRPGYWMAAVPE
ncbi:MAG: VWA domain-containing protein [Bryobacteraceae bacterium]|nr:VWA domain-containing protein [Bryobacteraceae bacterium]